MIQAEIGRIRVDSLRCVRVQRSWRDIRAIREFGRVGLKQLADQGSRRVIGTLSAGRIDQQRRTFSGQRHQHVAIDLATDLLLRSVDRETGAVPNRTSQAKRVPILVRGLHLPDLKERASGERAVTVGPRGIAVNAAAACWRQVKVRAGAPAVLGPVVVAVRLEVGHDGCCRAEANVEFLKSVRVNKIELNVLVATRLTGLSVLLPEQIQIGALCFGTALGRGAGALVRVGGIAR